MIVGSSGLGLLISTQDGSLPAPGAISLGRIPWSPRTPIVRVR